LRFAHDLRSADTLDVPGKDLKQLKITDREITMAEQLIENMEGHWDPKQFHEQYYEDVMQLIKSKIKSGKTQTIEEHERPSAPRASKIVDITELLKRSVAEAQQPAHRRKAS
jgi:DNA end-binding protein Ku